MSVEENIQEYAQEYFNEVGDTITHYLYHYASLRAYGMGREEAMEDTTIELYSFLEQLLRKK